MANTDSNRKASPSRSYSSQAASVSDRLFCSSSSDNRHPAGGIGMVYTWSTLTAADTLTTSPIFLRWLALFGGFTFLTNLYSKVVLGGRATATVQFGYAADDRGSCDR